MRLARLAASFAALTFALAAVPSAAAPAADAAQGSALARRVQHFYAGAPAYSAEFTQTYTYASFGRTAVSQGRVYIKRPNRLRWEYEKPEKKLIVLDGKSWWQHVPADNQVEVKRNFDDPQALSAFSFLWGHGQLLRDFEARLGTAQSAPPAPTLPKGEILELRPKKPSPGLALLRLWVGKNGQVVASEVTNAQGDKNLLVFQSLKVDAALADSLFQFKPPPGASVQEL